MFGTRVLSILALLALVAAGIALWMASDRKPTDELSAQGPLLPQLVARINDVSEVRITGAGAQRIATLHRTDDGWVMPEKDNVAVDFDALRTFLIGLAEAKRLEAKTASPDRYARLGVVDPMTSDQASGVRVDMTAGDDVFGLIVGSNRSGGTGTYVRVADEAQSWLTDRNIAVERRPAQWLQRQLTDIPASRIVAAEVSHPKTEDAAADTITIATDGKSGFILENLPKGREVADSYSTEALAGFMADLRFDDVMPAATMAAPEGGTGTAKFRSRNGIVIDALFWTVGESPERTMASFTASFDAAQAEQGIAAAQARARAEYSAAVIDADKQVADAAAAKQDVDAVSNDDPSAMEQPVTAPEGVSDATAAASPRPEAPLASTDPEADRAARLEAVSAEINAITKRVDGRVFQLPTFKASNLNKRLDDYLKPVGE